MILKRLLTTALGALGLSALAAGSAFAQTAGEGNIPAPDIFNDQIDCSMFVPITTGKNATVPMPTKIPTGGTESPLDEAIGTGTSQVTDTTSLGLGYVIPSVGANCGAGATGPMFGAMGNDANNDNDFLDAGDTYPVSSIPIDVADGYTALLAKFTAVYGDPTDATSSGTDGALKAAQKALNDAIAAGSTGTTLDPYNKAVTDAQAAHTKALAALNAADRGPIYQAGVAEWQAQSAVTNAIDAYNKQVVKTSGTDGTGGALAALNGLNYRTMQKDDDSDGNVDAGTGVSKYVPLGNNELTTGVVTISMGMGTVVLNQLIQYTNSDLNNPQVGTQGMVGKGTGDGSDGNDAPVASNSTDSNFDASGKLIIPMTPNTANDSGANADPTDLTTVKSTSNSVGTDIRATVMNTRIAAAALKKARDENTNPSTQAIYNEAYRRAKLEQDYYDALWQDVLSATDDLRTLTEQTATGDDAVAAYSISSRSAKYVTEDNKRFTREQTLRSAVAARVTATENTAAAFTSPQSFYEQLVARREALKTTADNAVTDAQKDGGTASKALLDDQKAKGEALTAAKDAKSSFDSLYSDSDDPKVALLRELVKTGGDDGQALADAVSSNYTSAAEAKTAADAAKTAADAAQTKADEVADSVAGLTGDDGSVGQNTASITANADGISDNAVGIAANADGISANAEDIDQIQMDVYGTTDLAHDSEAACSGTGLLNTANCNKAAIAHNAGDISDNADAISDNEDAISDNADGISDNADGISDNADAISANKMAIESNDVDIAANADGISANKMAIESNDVDIAANADGISANTMAIESNDVDIAANADGISANTMAIESNDVDIAANADGISANKMAIESNDVDIAANAGNISTNAGNIANNTMAIESNDADIAVNVDNIAANAGNIVVNAGNIATNAGDISTNAGNIATNASGIADNMAAIGSNASAIAANANSIGANASAIGRNASMIGELSEDLDVVRAGVAASMALAGMPAINGRGIAIGVGSYDGESAFAVGFQIQGEQASFKIGVTSSGGETGASAGVGFNF